MVLLTLQGIFSGWWMRCASITGHHTTELVTPRASAQVTSVRPHH
jgi:hypothetical protein